MLMNFWICWSISKLVVLWDETCFLAIGCRPTPYCTPSIIWAMWLLPTHHYHSSPFDISMLYILIHSSVIFSILYSLFFIWQSISTSGSSYILFYISWIMITYYAPTYGPSSWAALSRPDTSWLDYENSLLTVLIYCKEEIAPEPWISMGIWS